MRKLTSEIEQLSTCYIICSCEGGAEEAIIDILLNNNCLVFTRDNLLNHGKITRKRKASELQQDFLNMDYYPKKVVILRIVDSRSEKFKLSPLYSERYSVLTIRTTPEIEMLLLISEGKADAFRKQNKSKQKPSEYCKTVLRLGSNIKSYKFWLQYFSDVNDLLQTLHAYNKTKSDKKELSIYDLLTESCKKTLK